MLLNLRPFDLLAGVVATSVLVLSACRSQPAECDSCATEQDAGSDASTVDSGLPAPGITEFVFRDGVLGRDRASQLAIDSQGGIYVSGIAERFPDDDDPISFLSAYSATGASRWKLTFTGVDTALAPSIAVDSTGDLIVVGQSSAIGDETPSAQVSFIAKLDVDDGVPIWIHRFAAGAKTRSLVVDSVGDLIVTGPYQVDEDYGGGALGDPVSGDLFLAKFSGTDGGHLWSDVHAGLGDPREVVIDSTDSILVIGRPGLAQGVVAKFDSSNGSELWREPHSWEGTTIAVGPGNDVLVAGIYTGTTSIGEATLTSAGEADVVLVRLGGSDGQPIWARSFGGSGAESPASLLVSGNQVDLLSTFASPTIELGSEVIRRPGSQNAMLLSHYDADGNHVESLSYPSDAPGNWAVYPEQWKASGNTRWILGDFSGTVDFDGTLLSALENVDSSSVDFFVARVVF